LLRQVRRVDRSSLLIVAIALTFILTGLHRMDVPVDVLLILAGYSANRSFILILIF